MKLTRRGNAIVEAALFIPVLVTLLVGVEQLGKLTYTYYTLKKELYAAARYIATQQGVNICDPADPAIVAGINFALTSSTDGSGAPFIADLTSDMIQVTGETLDPASLTVGDYNCALAGTVPPDFVIVSIPNGYQVTPIIPFLTPMIVPLKPSVKVPYGGT